MAAGSLAFCPLEMTLQDLFWLASCPEFEVCTELHIVEKNKPGPSGFCDVGG